MKSALKQVRWPGAVVLFGLLLLALIATAPKYPLAIIRVQDAAGAPVVGAVVLTEGLRSKPGPYASGWYYARAAGATTSPVTTDADGYARVPYPKYVFERIETGTLCLSVSHPDFVPERPERMVATAPPAGAPWRVRVADFCDRIAHKALIVRPDPILLQKGAVLRISAGWDQSLPEKMELFAQVSGEPYNLEGFWVRSEPRVLMTRQLATGRHTTRLVGLDPQGLAWFSEVVAISAVAGRTNEVALALKRGVALHGRLDSIVPRPIRNGRVVAHVTPRGAQLQDSPPQWHDWSRVEADGSFVIGSLPQGDLEITALCDGFVSTNGPGQFRMRYPQRDVIGTSDREITIGMEPTARLKVRVTGENGQPLKGIRVMSWPNVRYGEWSATILMSDCYKTSDLLLSKPGTQTFLGKAVEDFQGVSDSSGLAVLPNLPDDVTELGVEDVAYQLPAISNPSGQKRRVATFALRPGETNDLSIQLEPRERSKISHY